MHDPSHKFIRSIKKRPMTHAHRHRSAGLVPAAAGG